MSIKGNYKMGTIKLEGTFKLFRARDGKWYAGIGWSNSHGGIGLGHTHPSDDSPSFKTSDEAIDWIFNWLKQNDLLNPR